MVIKVIAADLTPGVQIQPNGLLITLSNNCNMSFVQSTFVFEDIKVDTNEVRFSNNSASSPITFNSTSSFNNLNLTMISWNLTQNNVTIQVTGATLPNFVYFNISRNDSSSCYQNRTNLADGALNDYCTARLDASLVNPDPSKTKNIIQNKTFNINATVYCRDSDCGNVYGTVMYNISSINPNTPVNTTMGDKPFYVNETPPSQAIKACPSNPLTKDEFCNITWIINATGDTGSNWKIGVFFNSSFSNCLSNYTENANISILGCTIDFTIWSSINFGPLNPGANNRSAFGNTNKLYNITNNLGSCDTDFYIKGSDLENITYNSLIKVGNISWSNISSEIDDGYYVLSATDAIIGLKVPESTNVTTYYWLNVPPVYAGYYNGTVNITGVRHV